MSDASGSSFWELGCFLEGKRHGDVCRGLDWPTLPVDFRVLALCGRGQGIWPAGQKGPQTDLRVTPGRVRNCFSEGGSRSGVAL